MREDFAEYDMTRPAKLTKLVDTSAGGVYSQTVQNALTLQSDNPQDSAAISESEISYLISTLKTNEAKMSQIYTQASFTAKMLT